MGRQGGWGKRLFPPDPSHGLWSTAKSESVSRSVMSHSTAPWTVACQAPLSVGFSRQRYCSGWPFPPPGDLPNSGIKPGSPALAGRFFMSEPPRKPQWPGGQTLLGLGPQKGTGAEAEALPFLDGETLHRACAHSFLSEEAFLGSGILHSWTWKE